MQGLQLWYNDAGLVVRPLSTAASGGHSPRSSVVTGGHDDRRDGPFKAIK
jgi:hypothetical protein